VTTTAAATSTPTTTPSTTTTRSTWQIDPSHTRVEFSVRHMMVSTVKGHFTSVQGAIVIDEANPADSSVAIQIDPTSLTTSDEQRDAHLRSADFFDADQFPTITFVSTRVAGSRDQFKLTGDLTMHGVTREVTLDVDFNGIGTSPYGATIAGFSAETRINRKEWGLNWNVGLEAGGVLVGDQLKIGIEVEAIKQAA
jgi:polyisoprenoid-binding protein YceI